MSELYFPISAYKKFKDVPVNEEFYHAGTWYCKDKECFRNHSVSNCHVIKESEEFPCYLPDHTHVIQKEGMTKI